MTDDYSIESRPNARTSSSSAVHMIYASETGTAEEVGELLFTLFRPHMKCTISCVSETTLSTLRAHAVANATVLFVVATAGEGAPPRALRPLWRAMLSAALPRVLFEGLRMGVLGLGDSSYALFNAAARRLRARLSDLGAKEIFPAVLADAAASAGLEPEIDKFAAMAASALGVSPTAFVEGRRAQVVPRATLELVSSASVPRTVAIDGWMPHEALCGEKRGAASWTDAIVVENRVMTDAAFLEDDREVRHITLDVSMADGRSLLHYYEPGDTLHVLPRNRASAVHAFLKLMALDGDAEVRVTDGSTAHLNVCTPCRLDTFIAAVPDLSARVKRRFLERLAPFATESRERERLEDLSGPDGADDFETYAVREMRTPLIVLRDFPSSRPPFSHLIDMLPMLRSRAFSIAGARRNGKVELCAAIARFVTPLRFARVGVASAHFLRAEVGDVLPVRAEVGPRPQVDGPAVLIAAGAGAAFVRPIAAADGERMLFFGCRHRDADFLYRVEWETMVKEGRLKLFTAFSRMSPEKVYVQDRMREEASLVWQWIHCKKASVFVSGAAGGFPRSVRSAIVDIVQEEGKLTPKEAEKYVRGMETRAQMIVECW